MAEEDQFNEEEKYGRPLSWYQSWNLATTRPSVATYNLLIRDPAASKRRAFLWLLASNLVSVPLSVLFTYLFGGPGGQLFDQSFGTEAAAPSWLFIAICTPFIAIMSVISVMISAGLIHLSAKVLGGIGTYCEMLYVFAAIYAPLSLISTLLLRIPVVNLCLAVPFAIYTMVILIIAVKAVSDFGWGRAIVAYFAPLLLFLLVIVGAVAIVLLLLGALSGGAM